MNTKYLEHFRNLLLQKKKQILNGVIQNSKGELQMSSDDLADETDVANSVVNQNISFHIIHREFAKIRLIDEALLRIDQGYYGLCEYCNIPIGQKRLNYQPWATLCIDHAEEEERAAATRQRGVRLAPF